MKIEFTLKDRNGVELEYGDDVNWICANLSVEECRMGNLINKMWNSGEIIPGRLVFYKTIEQAKNDYRDLKLMFVSDDNEIRLAIGCPSEKNDYRHVNLERVEI